jgi:ligand-binding sensor domain-containing protein
MCVDKYGKLWFTTDKGLLRYDGNDIARFVHKDGDTTSLTTNSQGHLHLDRDGNIYLFEVGANDYMNTVTGKVTQLSIKIKDKYKSKVAFPYPFTQPYIDDDKSFWVGMYNVGFIHYYRETKKTDFYPLHDSLPFQSNSVYVIQRDVNSKNLLWLATDDGIYSFNKISGKLKRNFKSAKPTDSSFYDILTTRMQVGKDTIWFTVPQAGVGCYEIKTGLYSVFHIKNQKDTKITKIDIDFFERKSSNEFYIATDFDLPGTFNTITHRYSFNSKTSNNLPEIELRHIASDSSGNFWSLIYYQLYSAGHSLNKFRLLSFPTNKSTLGAENAFKRIIWDERTKYYYTAFDSKNEVFVLDSNMTVVHSIPIETSKNETGQFNIYDLGFDKNGRLWLTGTKFWTYDDKSKKFEQVNKLKQNFHFKDERFQSLAFKGDYIYMQPSNPVYNAIYRLNYKQLTCDSILLPEEIISDNGNMNQMGKKMDVLEIDKKQKFAYLCYHMSLFQLNLITGKAKLITKVNDKIKPFQHFYNMAWYSLDDDDRLWVSTLESTKVYEPENLKITKEIFPEKDVYPIQQYNIEGMGIMCILNSNGVLIVDYRNGKQFQLTASDGLISTFNSGLACIKNILFVGALGYIQYLPLSSVLNRTKGRTCYLSSIQIFNKPFATDTLPEFLQTLKLPHHSNFVTLAFSSTEYEKQDRLEYRYKLEGINKDWVHVNYLNRTITYNDLEPGRYIFYANVKNADGTWSNDGVKLSITIVPAWWQTNVFKVLCLLLFIAVAYLFVKWRIKSVRRQEQLKNKYEKELLELEAKALRAQMNPHFIFNCMNSIKSLIQKNEHEKAINYLTTFSKLIRTIFQNSDKREITLADEVETCRLYTNLESMRFGDKFDYRFDVDDSLDLKSVMVPALIIQPFIENAIWHGVMPKEEGGTVTVTIDKNDITIRCSIDDDGIGREVSNQNKFKGESSAHQSKGVRLTQSRLDLDNLLNERHAAVQIIDKKNEAGKATGTKVIIQLTEY